MAVKLRISVYSNSDDALVSWAPSEFIPGCRGFMLERQRQTKTGQPVDIVENRVGFARDKPKSGDHRPSNVWPFQRFNWTDHVVNVGNRVRYRATAMIADGSGRALKPGPVSSWTPWATLTADVGQGISCYFNRGLVLSQFVARYLREKKLSPAKFKSQLKTGADPKFRQFLEGDLGAKLRDILGDAADDDATLHAALYELDDEQLEDAMIAVGSKLKLILANGSDKSGDGNEKARKRLNDAGIPTIDRLLKSKGLGHNKFLVVSKGGTPRAVWTGSTNWATTGLCTQINNGLFIEDPKVARVFRQQWDRLRDASPPKLDPAAFPKTLVTANGQPTTVSLGGAKVLVGFTRTSDDSDMEALREIINSAKDAVLFLMFTPGKAGLHTLAAQRADDRHMYVRGIVSTIGNEKGDSDKNFLDVSLVSSNNKVKRDRYNVVQPQGNDSNLGPWIREVTRRDFLAQVGHAIVHSKILVIDPLSAHPVVVTGSHNFSAPASDKNDENYVVIRDHKPLAEAYAAHIMSVYQHYRFRSYLREQNAQGKRPWSALEDNDKWLKDRLRSQIQEINFWT